MTISSFRQGFSRSFSDHTCYEEFHYGQSTIPMISVPGQRFEAGRSWIERVGLCYGSAVKFPI